MTTRQVSEFKETEIGKIPVDWEVKKLGDIFELSQGLQISSKKRISENKENYIPLLKIRDLPTNKFSEFVSLDDITPVYVASKDDIIYTRTGQVGLVYTNVEGCIHNNCFKIHYGDFDKMFVYYTLNQRRVFEYANAVAGGSVQKDLTHPAFKSCLITYPKNKQEQIRISTFISNLDSKIQNLQKQNRILEEMAQAIFQSWFVDFDGVTEWDDSELGKIPKGWSVDRLEKFVDYLVGFPFKSREFYEGNAGIKLARGDNVKEQELVWGSKTRLWKNVTSNLEKFLVKQNDILIGMDGSKVGYNFAVVYDYDLPILLVQRVARLRSKVNYYDEFVWQLIKNGTFTNYILSIKTGSTIPHISKEQILNFSVISPPENMLKKFFTVTESIRKRISKNKNQINYLTKTRDTLLPKLMSGEIRV